LEERAIDEGNDLISLAISNETMVNETEEVYHSISEAFDFVDKFSERYI
jgi:hypothetical protein